VSILRLSLLGNSSSHNTQPSLFCLIHHWYAIVDLSLWIIKRHFVGDRIILGWDWKLTYSLLRLYPNLTKESIPINIGYGFCDHLETPPNPSTPYLAATVAETNIPLPTPSCSQLQPNPHIVDNQEYTILIKTKIHTPCTNFMPCILKFTYLLQLIQCYPLKTPIYLRTLPFRTNLPSSAQLNLPLEILPPLFPSWFLPF